MMFAAMRAAQQKRMFYIDGKLSPNCFNRAKIKATCGGSKGCWLHREINCPVPAQESLKKI